MGRGDPVDAEDLRRLLGHWSRPGTMITVSLADALAGTISDGALADGVRLPSARALSAALAVSRPTVHDAYDLLAVQGLLDRGTRQVINPHDTSAIDR